MLSVGRYTATSHVLGYFRLDGGAMFGSVPKNIWAKLIPPDSENCIRLATRSLLIQDTDHSFLIDVGLGEKWNDKLRGIFAIANTPQDELGFDPESITDIILTHLHFDHAGGISHHAADQTIALSYPNARIYLQEENLRNARNPNPKERASYLKENFEVLAAADLVLLRGDSEVAPGIRAHCVNGHTRGQQWIEIEGGTEASLFFATDLIPTAHHLPIPFHMGYDICAETLFKDKERFLSAAVARNAIVVFEHDTEIEACTVTKNEKGHYALKERVKI